MQWFLSDLKVCRSALDPAEGPLLTAVFDTLILRPDLKACSSIVLSIDPLPDMPGFASITSVEMPLPKYHRVYLVLREQLLDGRFDAGMPSEIRLAQDFGVGRVTVRRALQHLADEQLIRREPGRGTRPIKRERIDTGDSSESSGGRLTGLMDSIVQTSRRTSVRLVELSLQSAPAAIGKALALPDDARVWKVVRVRSMRREPVSLITAYVPQSVLQRPRRDDLRRHPLLELIAQQGIKPGRTYQTVSARQADSKVATHLDIAVGSALLEVERVVYDQEDRPVQWLHGLYRPERYAYHLDISSSGQVRASIWSDDDAGR
jgi:GntR family transcriptional regulator